MQLNEAAYYKDRSPVKLSRNISSRPEHFPTEHLIKRFMKFNIQMHSEYINE